MTPSSPSPFGDAILLRQTNTLSTELPLRQIEEVTRALRGALLHHASDPAPAILSGHFPDGRPLDRTHVAFVGLPGSSQANRLGDVALLLPREIAPADRQAISRAIARWELDGFQLRLGRLGALQLERAGQMPDQTADWRAASRRWASITAIALDENPGRLDATDAAAAAAAEQRAGEIIARACERIDLPRPEWVRISRRSAHRAAPLASEFMPYPRHGRGLRRVCVHAELKFAEAIEGPLLLGAGRYFGIGLCLPVADRSAGVEG
ncbi:MAG TPA: type I-U CRISPR-associated protein Csb2 [Terriglobales bacterium]|nr:type I-U CRISPR-associated protein Csb2 [Terriglobales bacterium]